MKELCFDISSWQAGIDYNALRSQANYCILRAGFGDSDVDSRFEEHYNNLQGLHLGAYWYSYATSPEGARAEARLCLSVINGKQFDLPIFLDMEEQGSLSRDTLDGIVCAFGNEIEKAGYYFAVYTNLNWYNNVLSGKWLNSMYDWWIACWGEAPDPVYGINYGTWQVGSDYYIGSSRVDYNYVFKDYPKIIRDLGLNHLDPESDFKYRSHVQNIGWQDWVNSPKTSGTTGQSLRLEALQIDAPFEIKAKAHLQDIGWVDYGKINKDTVIGTTGESRRLEDLCFKGDFMYRVHIEDTGWTAWTNADGIATLGTVGQSLRIEAIEMKRL